MPSNGWKKNVSDEPKRNSTYPKPNHLGVQDLTDYPDDTLKQLHELASVWVSKGVARALSGDWSWTFEADRNTLKAVEDELERRGLR